ncbi:hypothetical protein ACIQOF_36185 [Streptomyces sp. NPDC091265]|uniref:hypothetical protein n=1 Tax=unclassified Streptomyces TaxID=2593676 RepID=UPI003450AD6C
MDENSVYGRLGGQALPVPMPRAGALLPDGLVFHATWENTGPGLRPVVTMAYRCVDELSLAGDGPKARRPW